MPKEARTEYPESRIEHLDRLSQPCNSSSMKTFPFIPGAGFEDEGSGIFIVLELGVGDEGVALICIDRTDRPIGLVIPPHGRACGQAKSTWRRIVGIRCLCRYAGSRSCEASENIHFTPLWPRRYRQDVAHMHIRLKHVIMTCRPKHLANCNLIRVWRRQRAGSHC